MIEGVLVDWHFDGLMGSSLCANVFNTKVHGIGTLMGWCITTLIKPAVNGLVFWCLDGDRTINKLEREKTEEGEMA